MKYEKWLQIKCELLEAIIYDLINNSITGDDQIMSQHINSTIEEWKNKAEFKDTDVIDEMLMNVDYKAIGR